MLSSNLYIIVNNYLNEIEGDKGLVAKSKAAHHAISAPFAKAIDFSDKPLVVQYEVKYQKGGNCGGGYIKLLEDGFQTSGKEFDDKTPWTIMFGPDLTCPGTKVRVVFPHAFASTHVSRLGSLHLPPQEPHHWGVRGEAPEDSPQAHYRETHQLVHAHSQVRSPPSAILS